MKLNDKIYFFLAVICLFMFAGCATVDQWLSPSRNVNPDAWKPPLPADAAQRVTSGSRPLRQDDAVDVRIRAGAATSTIEFSDIVDAFGNITLPHLGEFKVGQLTTSEAEKAIYQAYVSGGFFTSPQVTLVCPNMIQPLEFFITGAVAKRGSFPFRDGITLWQAIVAAGDVTDFAGKKVKLIRGGITEVHDIRRIKSGRSKDPLLMPRDIVEVLETWL